MKKNLLLTLSGTTLLILAVASFNILKKSSPQTVSEAERVSYEKFLNEHEFSQIRFTEEELNEMPKKDRPDLAWEQDYLATMNPVLGRPEREKLTAVLTMTKNMQQTVQGTAPGGAATPWVERGPDNVGGRTRALVWDPSVANKVWAGSVTGGLWYNNDITNNSSIWQRVNDFWDNIAVTAIAFDPTNANTIYIGTGEGWGAGASRGAGIWKSTNGGTSFSQLPSTDDFHYINDLVVRNESGTGVIYAGVARKYYQGQFHGAFQGLQRSANGGSSWNQVLPNVSGTPETPTDIDISANNTLWVGVDENSFGNGGGKIYSSTSGTSFTLRHTHSSPGRINLACAPSDADYVYAAFEVGQVMSAFKQCTNATNASPTFTTRSEPSDVDNGIPNTDFTRGQAWYDLTLDVDPNNSSTVMIGGIDLFKTTDGGGAWTQISKWSNNNNLAALTVSEVHADQHTIVYKNGSSTEVLFGNDGGVYLSTNGNAATPTLNHRINGYNVTQYYACAINPTAGSNNFLAGAQDNGSQRYNTAGVNSTTEVSGGDGGYCHIDQTNAAYQTTSYTRNSIYHSSNTGSSFSQINSDQSTGNFINQSDLDNNQNILYTYRTQTSLYRITNFESATPVVGTLTIPNIGSDVSEISVSPYTTTSSTVFVGTAAGRIFKLTNAQGTVASTDITGGSFPTGSVSSIVFGASEDEILVTFSNYGVTSVWYTSNGTNASPTWVSKEGNLPDMPVRSALFNPNDYNEVIVATEVGVWTTTNLNAGSPSWTTSNSGLANVRVDMLQMRTSDNEVIAATHGRGLFSSNGFNDPNIFTANFSASNTNPNTAETVTFTDNTNLSPTSWTWSFSPNTVTYQGGTNANSQNPQVTFNNTGTYTVTLLAANAGDNDTEVKTNYINATAPVYCAAGTSNSGSEYITNVTLGTINNTTGDDGYTDYTAMSASLARGASHNLSVAYSNNYSSDQVKVWVDFNQNYNFTDPGEEFSLPNAGGAGGPYTLAIAIPAGATLGA
ncbi:MAG: GEVED domain-containing protein, partial [Vicingaceae bacterium]